MKRRACAFLSILQFEQIEELYMLTFLKDVYQLIPQKFRRKSLQYLLFSMINIFLDLISVAYIVPVIIFLIDKEKLQELILQYNIPLQINSSKVVYTSILILLGFYVLKNLLQLRFNNRLFAFLHTMATDLSSSYLNAVLKGDYLQFQQLNKGTVFQDLMKATTHFSVSLVHSLILLLTESLFFVFLILALGYFYPIITLGVFAGLIVFAALVYFRKKRQIKLINDTYNSAYSKVNSELINILDGYLEIKGSNNYPFFIDKFNRENGALNRVTALLLASGYNYSKYLETYLIFGIGALVYSNYLNTENDQIVLVSIIAAFGIKIIPSLSKILNALTHIKSHSYSLEKLKFIQDPSPVKNEITPFNLSIEFKDISFGYHKKSMLIDQLDLSIRRKEIIGITGVSGIGKTTLLHVAMGLISPLKGYLEVDQHTLPFTKYAPSYSYVTQQPFLFNGTILENIIMGQEKELIDKEYISFLLDHLKLQELVANLENGINTELNHNSLKLSGGQKQRLAFVRALYHKPDLLILDEATNQQNTALQSTIYEFLLHWVSTTNTAVLTVTHSESVFKYCEKVYLMNDGKLAKI